MGWLTTLANMDKAELLELIAHHGAHVPGLEAAWRMKDPEQILLRDCVNPSCGDRVEVELRERNGTIELRGIAEGCQLSRAAASLLAEALELAPLAETSAVLETLVKVRQGTVPAETAAGCAEDERFAELADLAVLAVAPLRRRCISMVWDVTTDLMDQASNASAQRR